MKTKRRRLERIAVLPTLLTLGNLLCGFWALIFIIKEEFASAAWLILLAMIVFDALDGQIARRVAGGTTKFGAQLDSLADMVSFGVAPAFLAYTMINQSDYHLISDKFPILLCAFYLVCVALRLARFNVETTAEHSFHNYFPGLPSPGAAGLLVCLVLLHQNTDLTQIITIILPFTTLILAVLMVTRLPYLHLMNRLTRVKYHFLRLVEIVLILLVILFKPKETLFAGFLIYTLSGPVMYVWSRLFPRSRLASTQARIAPAVNEPGITLHEKTDSSRSDVTS